MSFINYKYRPLYIEDIDYNISIKKKLVNLANNKMIDNIICYGGNGCGKKSFLNTYLNLYFDNDNSIYNLKTIEYTLSNNYKIVYKSSPRHFMIYLTDNPKNNVLILQELITSLCNTLSIVNNNTIIIIYNINKLQDNLIYLKYLSEKYINTKFLCSSNCYTNLSIPFLQLRFEKLSYFDLLKITLKINKAEKFNLDNQMIKKIILSSENLNSLLNNLQSYKNNYNPINILENIINTLLNKNINDFDIIKSNLTNLLIIQSHSINYILNYIFENIINHINNKYEFTHEYARLTENLILNNDIKSIILLDTIIFYIYKMF
tara:strand:+ start:94 stop:1050 length:957 start_codon:yes stop_codon:yes gene_type:complete